MTAPLPRLLLVEDDSFQATFFLRVLEEVQANVELHHACDGVVALERLADTTLTLPNLIILDINMPRLDGMQTLQRVRNDKRLAHIPVLMFSTSEEPREVTQAYSLGANGYLRKPRGDDEMNQVVQLLCSFVELNLISSPCQQFVMNC